MRQLSVSISDADVARPAGYIYGVFAPAFSALYVGQTRSSYGALGRLTSHLGEGLGATFRRRVCDLFRYDEVDLGPIEFAAYRLSRRSSFHGDARDYREAVEALTQLALIENITERRLAAVVISRVQLNSYTSLAYVRGEAERSAQYLSAWLSTKAVVR